MRVRRIGDLFTIAKGKKYEDTQANAANEMVRYIQIEDLRNDNNIKMVNKIDNGVYVTSNDVLIAWDGANAGTVGYNLTGIIGSTLAVLRPRDSDNYIPYIAMFLRSKSSYLRDNCTGATIPHIHKKVLEDIEVPLPSYDRQKEIAYLLDKAQALIDKRKQAIAKFDELVQAVFLDMFGDPTINQMGYPIGIIRDLIIEAKYGTSKKANEGTGQFPYLRMNNITYQGYMDYSNLKYIDLDDKEQEKYLVQRGDLLFNRTNSKELVGKTAVFDSDEKMAIAGYIVRVKTNDAGNPYFISGYLNSKHGKKVLQEMCKNIIGMANINAQELQNITILIPPRELQDSYERKVKAILEEKKKHLTQLQHLESNFQALLQKAFKGELKVKDGVEV
ncbi:restriction endonuclease subunit S [Paenibacillus pasadenensis]|uniref:Type I restriction-modification system, specificity subunit S n=1 Tax=Paenibacillus pasadenensis TaxID=217090 RepID=A0A2N5N8Z1_9BACL|nr:MULTISPECIES: restriction endonuclease subunit S [Paenibacillus]MPY19497.1 restriction endonuclease [Paenibacillus glucanolyticus]PLT46811.1 Type I restriction-modification system, specificity subunit S [Paenibacillus pasadenensis]